MKIGLWILIAVFTGLTGRTSAFSSDYVYLNDEKQVSSGYQIGDAVANFQLKNADGSNVSLNDFSGSKGIIVVFTSNHCPFAKAYEDRVIALNSKFASQGFPVIAINPSDPGTHQDDTAEKMKERSAAKSYRFPYLVDSQQQTARAFGAIRMPQVYILQKNGAKFIVRYMGMIDDNPQDPSGVTKLYVDEAVTNLLSQKPVVTTVTKPVGCAIKLKN
ncbi:thioredoxin family protein [Dyadobacter sediminis]|uniref:Thioredoxin family protein n=1 Tax=Dyadobacter sediminis TaxID=1493691 RepID=A0A5R9KAC8_9BACT|nr:thioredoxin family protein [Dyadobacter sediminis]TLU91725.1 thioredoxin family protein [Dyadobacter sediminis]GGC00840.1 thioredoxin family protein [Dyadobacter sediminis]